MVWNPEGRTTNIEVYGIPKNNELGTRIMPLMIGCRIPMLRWRAPMLGSGEPMLCMKVPKLCDGHTGHRLRPAHHTACHSKRALREQSNNAQDHHAFQPYGNPRLPDHIIEPAVTHSSARGAHLVVV